MTKKIIRFPKPKPRRPPVRITRGPGLSFDLTLDLDAVMKELDPPAGERVDFPRRPKT